MTTITALRPPSTYCSLAALSSAAISLSGLQHFCVKPSSDQTDSTTVSITAPSYTLC